MIMPYKGTLCNINTIKTVEQYVASIKPYSILYLQRWKIFIITISLKMILLALSFSVLGTVSATTTTMMSGEAILWNILKWRVWLIWKGGGISFLQMQSFMVPFIDICNLDGSGLVIWVLWVSRSWYEFSVWYDYQNPDTDMALGMAMVQSLTVISNWK